MAPSHLSYRDESHLAPQGLDEIDIRSGLLPEFGSMAFCATTAKMP